MSTHWNQKAWPFPHSMSLHHLLAKPQWLVAMEK